MLETVLDIAKEASEIILDVYRRRDLQVQIKDDSSPLTQADLKSHAHICQKLAQHFPYPILSEEEPIDYEQRRTWKVFWSVDPLDGTKDFIAGTNDFTVNIALIEGGRPVLGVVAVPAQEIQYFAAAGQGAFKSTGEGRLKIFNSRQSDDLICTDSRFHSSERVQEFCRRHGIAQTLRFGSAVKLCMLAEGTVDVYPRFGPTKEWDTAAGHCILNEAGCKLIDMKTQLEMVYNRESLTNNGFVASSRRLDFMPI